MTNTPEVVPARIPSQLFVISFLLLAHPSSAAGIDIRAVDEALNHSLRQTSIPGVVAMATGPDGVIYSGSFGKRGTADNRPLNEDAIFRIYSMTKAVTSVAVMQLVEQRLVALDNPAESYVPELAKVQVLEGFAGDGTARFREPAHPPTVRHLLTHTSGFGDLFWS
ncbi:MAG: beta-lactamase family protein, partial [bacterium]|nr:beta-lactamase family protein [bacterium]